MVKVLFDTNILIDVLRGIPPAQDVMISYPERAIQYHQLDGGHGWRARDAQ